MRRNRSDKSPRKEAVEERFAVVEVNEAGVSCDRDMFICLVFTFIPACLIVCAC